MLGNFVYSNPTKLYFGKDSPDNLSYALNGHNRIMLVYGGGSVITNHAQKLKIGHVFGENVFPKFAILNPEVTFTLPEDMIKGIADSTLIMTGGYKVLERDEVIKILRESM